MQACCRRSAASNGIKGHSQFIGRAVSLKKRVLDRLQRYIDGLKFGEPVRASEVIWSIMNEPGLADALDLQLLRFPGLTQSALTLQW